MSKQYGLSLVEILITLVIVSLVLGGASGFFISNKRLILQENLSSDVEANLRLAKSRIADSLRAAGYGVPDANLASWTPWVTGFSANPLVTDGTGTDPDTLSIANCSSQSVAVLTAAANASDTTLSVDDTSLLDTADRRLMLIDTSENAWVTNVTSSTSIDIDTDPATVGNQGLANAYPIGTPICRVDVLTFDIDTSNNYLRLNKNDGSGAQPLVDRIVDLQVESLSAGVQYRITLTARSDNKDPETNAFVTRGITSVVTLKN